MQNGKFNGTEWTNNKVFGKYTSFDLFSQASKVSQSRRNLISRDIRVLNVFNGRVHLQPWTKLSGHI